MFRSLFHYWYNLTDTPAILSRINIFFYMNIRVFRIKLNNYIAYLITTLSGFKLKNIKVFYNLFNFEYLYFKFLGFFFFFFFFFFLF